MTLTLVSTISNAVICNTVIPEYLAYGVSVARKLDRLAPQTMMKLSSFQAHTLWMSLVWLTCCCLMSCISLNKAWILPAAHSFCDFSPGCRGRSLFSNPRGWCAQRWWEVWRIGATGITPKLRHFFGRFSRGPLPKNWNFSDPRLMHIGSWFMNYFFASLYIVYPCLSRSSRDISTMKRFVLRNVVISHQNLFGFGES